MVTNLWQKKYFYIFSKGLRPFVCQCLLSFFWIQTPLSTTNNKRIVLCQEFSFQFRTFFVICISSALHLNFPIVANWKVLQVFQLSKNRYLKKRSEWIYGYGHMFKVMNMPSAFKHLGMKEIKESRLLLVLSSNQVNTKH